MATLAIQEPSSDAQSASRTAPASPVDDTRWQSVAPGRVEPRSGEIKITPSMAGRISEVLANPNDKVFAGEALISFDDAEARARVASARAQIAVRKRSRNEQSASGRAADRRKAEDAVADAEDAVIAASAAVDKTAVARRTGKASDVDLKTAQTAFARAQDRLTQARADLRSVEADPATPLPTLAEGQLNIARMELRVAEAELERLIIRSPIDATVLQVNAKPGEFGAANSARPLVSLGDLSALRVRAELDEQDYGAIKIGQQAIIRADAYRDRDFAGIVASIAPIVSGRLSEPGQHNLTDVNVAEVLINLAEPKFLSWSA